ncbi:MAG: hypothetical protein AAGI72_15335 [Pseudomonadota bacterium]
MNDAALNSAQDETDATCEPFRGTFPEWLRSMTDVDARKAAEVALDDMAMPHGDMANALATIAEDFDNWHRRSQRFEGRSGVFMGLWLEALRDQYQQEIAS